MNKENVQDKKEDTDGWGSAVKYLGLGFEIIVFAIVGYIVASALGYNEILGMAAGAIFGTFFMYFHLYSVVKKFSEKSEGEK